MVKKILFVCKYNKFRSQVANQFFIKYNKNRNIKSQSAGIFKGLYPLDRVQQRVAKEFGIETKKVPETISIDALMDINLVVIAAKDVPKELFSYEGKYLQKVIKWEIGDEFLDDEENIRRIIRKIELKVKDLVKKLEKEK